MIMTNWTISEIKRRGMATFMGSYWKCLLVALIISLATGGFSAPNFSFNNYNIDNFRKEDGGINVEAIAEAGNPYSDLEALAGEIVNSPQFGVLVGALIFGILIAIFISIALSVFLLTPLIIGCQRFFKEAGEKRSYELGNIAFAFKEHYMNIVRVAFIMDLRILLWSLLFIIPGIIKSYEYRMIPYILGDDPTIPTEEAFRRSKEMMHGHKWHSFLLDLSFFGWVLLSVFTCGILMLFYVGPYMAAADAELYITLKGTAGNFDINGGIYNGQPYGGNTAGYNTTYGQDPSYGAPYGQMQQPYGSSEGSPSQGYTEGEYREPDKVNNNSGNDTPAFGDERNRLSNNDKPFNTPY